MMSGIDIHITLVISSRSMILNFSVDRIEVRSCVWDICSFRAVTDVVIVTIL